MSQQNGFGSGFVLGSLIGGVVGGVLGTVIATRKERQIVGTDTYQLKTRQERSLGTEESIELARHGLEDKIAQLNSAIDDVRQQLGTVKASSEQD
ncbi:MAG: hypothetical protein HC939_12435 [Pleurocapsa sp. SU_5_0]|nr:hypothetical protein [Pleurocapsa sp. SU_5_0]NJO95910.1 hypothetical protein [Pleurocapsa sp. CRU_1_2]NJR46069.1 hypothetical protein [Hyellaceae cyanobacterium CSU_1_1]